jgi:hypothetical protein
MSEELTGGQPKISDRNNSGEGEWTVKLKVTFTLEHATKSERGSRGIATLSLTSALDGGGWSSPRSGRFTRGKDTVPIVQRAQGWFRHVRKISLQPGFDSRTVQPVASRYTDWANLAHVRGGGDGTVVTIKMDGFVMYARKQRVWSEAQFHTFLGIKCRWAAAPRTYRWLSELQRGSGLFGKEKNIHLCRILNQNTSIV